MGGAPGASCICCGGAPGIARPGGGAPGIVRPGGGSGGAFSNGVRAGCEKPGLACWSGCASGTAPTVHISSSATEAGAETGDDIGACASASSETWASASSENGDAANPASGGVGAGPGAAVGGGGFILH